VTYQRLSVVAGDLRSPCRPFGTPPIRKPIQGQSPNPFHRNPPIPTTPNRPSNNYRHHPHHPSLLKSPSLIQSGRHMGGVAAPSPVQIVRSRPPTLRWEHSWRGHWEGNWEGFVVAGRPLLPFAGCLIDREPGCPGFPAGPPRTGALGLQIVERRPPRDAKMVKTWLAGSSQGADRRNAVDDRDRP
jgi:hypothetical protein